MRDLDLLVDPKHRRTVEEILLGMGFYQRSVNSQAFYAAHHHSMPSTTVRGMYGLKFIVAVSLNVEIRSLPVLALMMLKHNPSYLLLTTFRSCGLARSFKSFNTASYWGLELRPAGGVLALIDNIYLLARAGDKIRWNLIVHWVKGPPAAGMQPPGDT
jgi:hypothetical protein